MLKVLSVWLISIILFISFGIMFGTLVNAYQGPTRELFMNITLPVTWSSLLICSIVYLTIRNRFFEIFDHVGTYRAVALRYFFLVSSLFLINYFLHHVRVSENSSGTSQWGLVFAIGLIGPLGEELYFRGIVCDYLLNKYSEYKAIILQSFLFMLAHFVFKGDVVDIFIYNVSGLTLGVLLGLVYLRTRSMLICWALHAYYNLLFLNFIAVRPS